MDPYFSVFNNHVNRAGVRADREFKAQYGQENFNEFIAPLRTSGIMEIFEEPKNAKTAFFRGVWISLVTNYVNENVRYRLTPDGPMPVKIKRKKVRA